MCSLCRVDSSHLTALSPSLRRRDCSFLHSCRNLCRMPATFESWHDECGGAGQTTMSSMCSSPALAGWGMNAQACEACGWIPARPAAFLRLLQARDRSTLGHASRVCRLVLRIGRELRLQDIPTKCVLRTAAVLHDIGKLAVPTGILNKPGRLTSDEYGVAQRHSGYGEAMAMWMGAPALVLASVRHHHERRDGTGYPDGLHGEQIPLPARILADADCYDALSSDRPCRGGPSRTRGGCFPKERYT